jgi:hypothetical protein
MRPLPVVLAVTLTVAACSDAGTTPAAGEKARRGQGMSEEIWKIYSGTEAGVGGEEKPNASGDKK